MSTTASMKSEATSDMIMSKRKMILVLRYEDRNLEKYRLMVFKGLMIG
jgi:hypothetical protein